MQSLITINLHIIFDERETFIGASYRIELIKGDRNEILDNFDMENNVLTNYRWLDCPNV